MTDGRVNVLSAIDRQLRLGTLPPSGSLQHPGVITSRQAASGDLVAQFTRELEALAVTVHHEADDRAATTRVLALLDERGESRVLAWDPEWLNCQGLSDAIDAHGIVREPCWLPADIAERRARLAAIDDVRVGLTGALAGLADTGSLALVSGPGRARIASLLPPMHVAVLRADQIVPSFGVFLAAHPHVADEGSNLALITGPSRTADIEMTLTRGVHGPGHVHVVIIG
ncbi:MAG TPA: lactate utilization protein [Vicinamibacterales bacterium]|jgi:L-lactate dehydrogenase complex protein LldG|nr:lactate utilization protein [Vicinamibacterales bacterium]